MSCAALRCRITPPFWLRGTRAGSAWPGFSSAKMKSPVLWGRGLGSRAWTGLLNACQLSKLRQSQPVPRLCVPGLS